MPYTAIPAGWLLATEATTDSQGGSLFALLLPLLIFGGLFYVALVFPQRRRMRQMQQLRRSVEVGDEIRTIGGILGRVQRIDDEEVTIDVGGGTILHITVRAIAERLGGDGE